MTFCSSAGQACAVFAPAQAGETFTTLKENIFVCVSPQAYDDAMVRVRGLNSRDIEPLKKELSEKKQCMFVDPEMADNIMAPYAVVLQRDGTKVQVQFIVTFRETGRAPAPVDQSLRPGRLDRGVQSGA